MFFFVSFFLGMFSFISFFVGFRNPRKKEKKEKKSSTISIGKKEKTEVGDEDGEGVKINPEEIWNTIFIRDSF